MRIYMINEKGMITHKNKCISSTYSSLNEMCDLIFPSLDGNNTNFSYYSYFKEKLPNPNDLNIDEILNQK